MSNLDKYNHKPSGDQHGKRGVPLTTRIAVAFGGFFLQFGAAFFTFGMIFWWFFGAQADVTSWYKFSGNLAQVQGTALTCTDTGMSVGGSKHSRGTPVYKTTYGFDTSGGHFEGECYGTGLSFSAGQAVPVEYVTDDPATSRIVGTRKKPWEAWVLFVGIFPLAGLALMVVGMRGNLRKVRILKSGKLARGRLVDKQPTNTRINNQTVYKFTFEYEDDEGRTHQISDRTHVAHLLEDEETERLIYNRNNPSEGLLVDIMAGHPGINAQGEIGAANPGAAFMRMLLPVGGVAAHVAVGVILYML